MGINQIIIDRIENGFAVCEVNSNYINIPLSKIADNVQEGDVLIADESANTEYTMDIAATIVRRNNIVKRFDRIKRRSNK